MLLTRYNTGNISKILEDIDRFTIGLDPWFDRLTEGYSTSNYPPYNLVDSGEGRKRLDLAVAGFHKDEISVYTEKNQLVIEGSKSTTVDEKYHYNGIANRSFRRSWTISDEVRVNEVRFSDGLLSVEITTVVPEHQRKQVYNIV